MSEQLAVTLAASAIGVLSAVFFCVGNALNSTAKIIAQSATYWDFSESLARSLAAQRAQYVTGGLLLVAAFSLQVWAALASPTTPASLPRLLASWQALLTAVLAPVGVVAWVLCELLTRRTVRLVLAAHVEQATRSEPPPSA
jgi:hypothetical protein